MTAAVQAERVLTMIIVVGEAGHSFKSKEAQGVAASLPLCMCVNRLCMNGYGSRF